MSDFGKIYSEWENLKKTAHSKDAKQKEEDWLEKYPPPEDYSKETQHHSHPGRKRQEVLRMAFQDEIDLHGYTLQEGKARLLQFITASRHRGLKKVLIIHGKGLHSADRHSRMAQMVLKTLSSLSDVGETGYADRKHGGRGATWAVLRTA